MYDSLWGHKLSIHYRHSYGHTGYSNTLPHCMNWHSRCIQDTQQCCTMAQGMTLVVLWTPVCFECWRRCRLLIRCCTFWIVWERNQYNDCWNIFTWHDMTWHDIPRSKVSQNDRRMWNMPYSRYTWGYSPILWFLTACSLVGGYQCFSGTSLLHLQGEKVIK
jgi:hypothetical protein